jgi:hypothetical protein
MYGYYIDIMIPDGWTSKDEGVTIIKKSNLPKKYDIPPGYELVSHKQLDRLGIYTTVAKQLRQLVFTDDEKLVFTDDERAEYQNCLDKEGPFDDRCNELLDKLMQSKGGKRKSRKSRKTRKSRKSRKSRKTKPRKSKSHKK